MRWDILKRFQQRTSEDFDVFPEPNPDSDTLGTVRQAVQKLPSRYREVIVLRYLEQLPTAQIAAILGLNLNTVNVRLNRARVQLKEKLADWIED